MDEVEKFFFINETHRGLFILVGVILVIIQLIPN